MTGNIGAKDLSKASNENDRKAGHLISRNVTVNGHRTSVRLELEMWGALTDICRRENATLHAVCSAIASQLEKNDNNSSLTSAIRVFIIGYFRTASTEAGHLKAGHGHG